MNVFETLSRAARQWPDRPALIDDGGTLDYQSLWREIETVRLQLDHLGLRAGEGVGVLARNGRGFVISCLAALGCGGVVLPIYHQLKPDELADLFARAPIAALIEDGSRPQPALAPRHGLQLLSRTGLHLTFSQVPRHAAPRSSRSLVPWLPDAAFVRFTSGTTGAAKGVILTHQGVLERTAAANAGLQLGCRDTILWVLPMAYHFFVSILLYLRVGAAVVVSSDHLAETLLNAAERQQATFLYFAPMHVRLLTAHASGRRLPPTLKRAMSVSSPLHPQTARDFSARFGLPVTQGYGVIEVGLPIMNLQEAAQHPEAIGCPVPGFEAAILDDQHQPAPDGQTGHLALRGPGMFAGYLSPRLAASEVLRDGWFLTGDLAHRDAAGRFTLDGRCNSVINVAGHKVFPEEVAAVLDLHPAVCRSRITTRSHPRLGEIVHAEVQLRQAAEPVAPEEILAFCRRRLSSYKVPASLDLVAEINLTPNGKVRHG